MRYLGSNKIEGTPILKLAKNWSKKLVQKIGPNRPINWSKKLVQKIGPKHMYAKSIGIHTISHCLYGFLDSKKLAASNLPFQVFEGFIGT